MNNASCVDDKLKTEGSIHIVLKFLLFKVITTLNIKTTHHLLLKT